MTIKTKIIASSVTGIAITGLALIGIVMVQKAHLEKDITQELNVQAKQQCASIARDVYLMLRTQHESVKQKVTYDLNVARDVMNQAGKVAFADEKATWKATNQYTKEAKDIELPKMTVGATWLGQNRDMKVASPVVDQAQKLVGGTCTIFQRMNEAGDMLRVCTNVEKLDNTRAVGTYIPAVNPDGTPNPVVSTVMKGETFNGRAYVVNDWYITAYEPIFDEQKKVVGVLYVGVKQENVKEIRQGIMDIVVGKTGYIYILGGSGKQQGHYLVSKGGKRDGENIWNAKDALGNLFIQSVVKKGLATKDGNCDFERYPWQNKGESESRWKVAAVTYFEPWDWVIGAGTYEDDFQDAATRVSASLNSLMAWTAFGAAITFLACGFLAFIIARKITRRIDATANVLKDLSQGEGDLTKRFELKNIKKEDEISRMERNFNDFVDKIHKLVCKIAENASSLASSSTDLSSTSNQMASGAEKMSQQSVTVACASEQMAGNMKNITESTEEMSENIKSAATSVEEMTSSIGEIAKNAEEASQVADKAANLAVLSNDRIGELGTAADEIGKVIEVIQDIAEQTNLLALNATIEAARAGDAGKGFAVVATEVKELAKQTAEATEDISQRIAAIQSSTGESVEAISQISEVINNVNEVSRSIASAVEEQSITTQGIAQNVAKAASGSEVVSQGIAESASASQEITQNITQVDQSANATSQGAVKVNESSSALSQLADQLQSLVSQFRI